MNCIFANPDCTGKLAFRMPLAAIEKSAAMCEYHWTLRQNDVRVAASTGCTCWEGYERVPGTKPCESGSCRKKSSVEKTAVDPLELAGLAGALAGPAAIVWHDTHDADKSQWEQYFKEEDKGRANLMMKMKRIFQGEEPNTLEGFDHTKKKVLWPDSSLPPKSEWNKQLRRYDAEKAATEPKSTATIPTNPNSVVGSKTSGEKLDRFKELLEGAGEKLFDVKMMPPGFKAPEKVEEAPNAVTQAAEAFAAHPIIQRLNDLGDAGEAQMAAWFKKMKGSRNDSLVEALKEVLGNSFSMYVRTHGAHWNVEGSDFAQYHELFETIYEDVYGSIDPLAENIRKLEGKAPGSISDFEEIDGLDSATEPESSTDDLAQDISNANRVVLESLDKAFKIANDSKEQGIANFLAERIDMHQKWAWQLSASMSDGAESTDE